MNWIELNKTIISKKVCQVKIVAFSHIVPFPEKSFNDAMATGAAATQNGSETPLNRSVDVTLLWVIKSELQTSAFEIKSLLWI